MLTAGDKVIVLGNVLVVGEDGTAAVDLGVGILNVPQHEQGILRCAPPQVDWKTLRVGDRVRVAWEYGGIECTGDGVVYRIAPTGLYLGTGGAYYSGDDRTWYLLEAAKEPFEQGDIVVGKFLDADTDEHPCHWRVHGNPKLGNFLQLFAPYSVVGRARLPSDLTVVVRKGEPVAGGAG